MMQIADYRRKGRLLADYLPWAALVAPGIVLNKDGSLQRSFRFRGPDLESASEAELIAACARLNNMLRRFGNGWALFFEATRHPAPGYPQSSFSDAASWLVDQERQARFAGEDGARHHFESSCYLTLCWLPPVDELGRLEQLLLLRPKARESFELRERLAFFRRETDRAFDLLQPILAEIEPLDDEATLTYLHGCISTRRHRVKAPSIPVYLDALLVDTPLVGGLEPMLGEQHLRSLTVLGFPDLTRPGLLDDLNQLAMPYRWMSRFIPMDKPDAERMLNRLRRQWFARRKSMLMLLREVLYQQPAPLIDPDADNKVADADLALQELGGDHVTFGYLTITVTISDASASAAADKLRMVEKVINGAGFATIRESVNAVEAWLGSLPGHLYANIRQPLIHSLNLAHLVPLSCIWAGPERNDHLAGPPLLLAETRGATPFRLSTHIGDVGHMMIVGPTGAGKSVLLALIALQFRRYPDSRIAIFDKGASARLAVLAMGGCFHDFAAAWADGGEAGPGAALLQPLCHIDEPAERSWAVDWVLQLLAQEAVVLTPEVKDAVWSALNSLASAPEAERTLTGLVALLPSRHLQLALKPFTLEGPHGALLDGARQQLALADVTCFEMEALMRQPQVILPVLTYLFHLLEKRFDGCPGLLVLDEAWLFLDHPLFAARLRDWLKTLRKKNVAVIFATQSLADIAASSIAATIIESCPQRIFLPNDRAHEPQLRAIYEGFGLNARQIGLIATASSKRDYYLQSRRGNRLFELGLGPIALSLCAAASPRAQRLIDELLIRHGRQGLLKAWLRKSGLSWAAELAEQYERELSAAASDAGQRVFKEDWS
ncbi:conjugal transfer protein TrbE [uncultured Ferrovibrio sp.]|jgi:Type IV secretory pathway, VirB4 components|uniref:conjugal transfer protein TrbE n=1 Tax=uncultured Ferrovibrio sp. TaxID=1576913 RepID=UPI00260D61DA|nr:conjugal transfer protein TrbE [uncultured Ferrovibrio sp.]